MLAGLNIKGETSVTLPKGSRNHTELFLEYLGAAIAVTESGDGGEVLSVSGPFRPSPFDGSVPGDPSSAAFFAVLASIAPSGPKWVIEGVLRNTTRNGFIACLKDAGVRLTLEPKNTDENSKSFEPIMDLVVEPGRKLNGFDIEGEVVANVIDEIPILGVLAAFSDKQTSHFRNLEELRVKESDRLAKTCELLELAGVKVESGADYIYITGVGDGGVRSFRFDPEGDHRLAMAAAVLASRASGTCEVLGAQCVEVSFPRFFDLLTSLG